RLSFVPSDAPSPRTSLPPRRGRDTLTPRKITIKSRLPTWSLRHRPSRGSALMRLVRSRGSLRAAVFAATFVCVLLEMRMAFRRSKSDHHSTSQEWHSWIDRHRAEFAAIGLPAELYVDATRWNDFLENGHLHWRESSGFEFGDLSAAQLAALRRFL